MGHFPLATYKKKKVNTIKICKRMFPFTVTVQTTFKTSVQEKTVSYPVKYLEVRHYLK